MELVHWQHGGVMIPEIVIQLGGPRLSCHDSKHLPCWCPLWTSGCIPISSCLENDSALHFLWWRESEFYLKMFPTTFVCQPVLEYRGSWKCFILPSNSNVLTVWPHDFWVTGREGILHHVNQITWTPSSSTHKGHVCPCYDEPRMMAFRLHLQSLVCFGLAAEMHMIHKLALYRKLAGSYMSFLKRDRVSGYNKHLCVSMY